MWIEEGGEPDGCRRRTARLIANSPNIGHASAMFNAYINLPRQVHLLCLGTLVNRAGAFVLAFLTIYVNEKLGYSVRVGTQCFAVFGVGSLVASIIGGQLADRIGRRPVMLIALFGGATMLLVMSVVQDQYGLMACIFAFALLNEMYRPAASAMIGDVCTASERAKAYSLMYVAINLGMGIGPMIGGAIAEHSYALLFVGDAATTALYGVIILLVIKESAPHLVAPAVVAPVARPKEKLAADAVNLVDIDYVPRVESRASLLDVFRDGPYLIFCAGGFLLAIVFTQFFTVFGPWLRDLGIGLKTIGYLIGLNGIMIFFCQLPITNFMERYQRMGVIVVGALLVSGGIAINVFADGLASDASGGSGTLIVVLALSVVVWTVGEMMSSPTAFAAVTDFAPVELRARYHGVYALSFSMALVVGALVGGEVLERFDGATLWLMAAGAAFGAAVCYVMVYRPLARRRAVE